MTAPLRRLGNCHLPVAFDGKRATRKGRMDIQLPITSQQWLKGYISSTSSFCFGVFFQNVEQGHKLKGALFVARVSERN